MNLLYKVTNAQVGQHQASSAELGWLEMDCYLIQGDKYWFPITGEHHLIWLLPLWKRKNLIWDACRQIHDVVVCHGIKHNAGKEPRKKATNVTKDLLNTCIILLLTAKKWYCPDDGTRTDIGVTYTLSDDVCSCYHANLGLVMIW